jgi:hypothetical protein
LDLSRRVGRGDIWRRQLELLENRVYNKPNGCSASGALAPGPDHQQQLKKVSLEDLQQLWHQTLPDYKGACEKILCFALLP